MQLNKVMLLGNLGNDPSELRTTSSGTSVLNFSLGVNDGYGDRKSTFFVDVTVWGKTAESCAKYLRKGARRSRSRPRMYSSCQRAVDRNRAAGSVNPCRLRSANRARRMWSACATNAKTTTTMTTLCHFDRLHSVTFGKPNSDRRLQALV